MLGLARRRRTSGVRSGWREFDERDFVASAAVLHPVHERPDQQDASTADLANVLRIARIGKLRGIEARPLIPNDESDFVTRYGGTDVDTAPRVRGRLRRRSDSSRQREPSPLRNSELSSRLP